jgi:sucrose-6-phosphate hydrolase SacC (GH32 family)
MKNILILAISMLISCTSGKNNGHGWVKYEGNPVLGGPELGTIFDISVIGEDGIFMMYSSWRPKRSIALSTSADGIVWTQPEIVLEPDTTLRWEEGQINRIAALKKDGIFHLWYTGQARDSSWIGYATSPDGRHFSRRSKEPVLAPEQEWEKVAVMCPHVNWDEEKQIFRMWYSGGEQYEPNAIGYATSPDGLHWTKYSGNPIFAADPANEWEQHKVTACQVIKRKNDYLMFYIGFKTEDIAQIGMAKSPDGIGNWTRYVGNPIVAPTPNSWDHDACYKPFAILDGDRWLLWYNGRYTINEYIGLVIHEGKDLGF